MIRVSRDAPSAGGGSRRALRNFPALLLCALVCAGGTRADLPAGYGALEYDPPEPGTYELPVLSDAADGEVLDETGGETRLHQIIGDGIVLLSFIYSTCSDTAGCPLATTE